MSRYEIAVRTLKIKTPSFDDLNQVSYLTSSDSPLLILIMHVAHLESHVWC